MPNINQKEIEKKWQDWWDENEIYRFDPESEKPVYSIDNPPRYASGGLHVGHAVHYTHIDFAARYKRLRGYNVFFPLCFDTNGIPIEERVERKLGITRKDIDRQEFIKLCREFANSNIAEMTRQFKILGETMDPSIYYQTDAEHYRRLTQISFIELFHKGLIYKGEHPVNWCPRCMTALADAEVEYQDRKTQLNYIKFKISDRDEDVIIATTRPELLCTCQLVAINPRDDRAGELAGKILLTPVYERQVEIVEDDKVLSEFGTGIVMICSIGDKDDLEWIFRYGLNIEKGIDEYGQMTEAAGKYQGMTIKEAKEAIIKDMKEQGLLIKQEELDQSVGSCWRCKTPIEFLQVPQWFLKLLDFKRDVLRIADEIKWFPEFMKIRLQDWVNSLTWDWVISRQRYFATPIPIWECVKCDGVVVAKEEQCYVDPTVDSPPVDKCPKCGGELKGCEDVFDTWMDSSISPLFNTFWKRDDEMFKKLYPMSLRPQAQDIIRTWAFYTIIREHLLVDQKPWEDIMIGAYILAEDGTPMHASKGNAIDPIEILDEYGSDAMRYYAATCALGMDNPFRLRDIKRGVRLCTKLWNVETFINKALGDKKEFDKSKVSTVDKWILSRYSQVLGQVTQYMDEYQFDKAAKEIENFLWHEFADHYIEMVKHRVYDQKDEGALYTLYTIGLGLVKILATFLPHITEEIYQAYFKGTDGKKSLHLSDWPDQLMYEDEAVVKGELARDVIALLRNWKSDEGLPLNSEISSIEIVAQEKKELFTEIKDDIAKTIRAKELQVMDKLKIEETPVAIKPIYAKLGPEYKENMGEIVEVLKNGDPTEVSKALEGEGYEITLKSGDKTLITRDFVEIEMSTKAHGREMDTLSVDDITILVAK
ncbi:MAG: valine--tRNA ligase [Thermoplasmata archaeon]|nr:MAG: valine--tRNA ligase [Thermoplasmata archaeon]